MAITSIAAKIETFLLLPTLSVLKKFRDKQDHYTDLLAHLSTFLLVNCVFVSNLVYSFKLCVNLVVMFRC